MTDRLLMKKMLIIFKIMTRIIEQECVIATILFGKIVQVEKLS